MARRQSSYYDRPVHQRLALKISDGLISAGAVYLLSPYLLKVLAPLQAQINATAASNGATVANSGTASIANKIITAATGVPPVTSTPTST